MGISPEHSIELLPYNTPMHLKEYVVTISHSIVLNCPLITQPLVPYLILLFVINFYHKRIDYCDHDCNLVLYQFCKMQKSSGFYS